MVAHLAGLALAALPAVAWALRGPPYYLPTTGKPCERDAETHAPICSLDPWLHPGDSTGRPDVRLFEPYVAKSRPPPKGVRFDENTTALVFLHVSKSGGMTVRDLLGNVAKRKGLGAVQLVTARKGWAQVLQKCSDPEGRASNELCNGALYSSTNGLGLCEFINRPYCMYVTTVREPLSRLLSSYNYFCTLGKEHGKGWLPGWTSCRWNEAQWAALMADLLSVQLGSNQAPLRRLSASEAGEQCSDCPYLSTAPKGAARDAILAAAKQNLASGAVRPLFLDSLAGDLQALAGELKLPELAEEAARSKPENVHPHAPRDHHTVAFLRHTHSLAGDLDLYQYATALRA